MSNDRKGPPPYRFPLNDPDRPYRGLFGNALNFPPKSDWLSELANALQAHQPPSTSTTSSLGNLLRSSPATTGNALQGLSTPAPSVARTLPTAPAVRRKVFFS